MPKDQLQKTNNHPQRHQYQTKNKPKYNGKNSFEYVKKCIYSALKFEVMMTCAPAFSSINL